MTPRTYPVLPGPRRMRGPRGRDAREIFENLLYILYPRAAPSWPERSDTPADSTRASDRLKAKRPIDSNDAIFLIARGNVIRPIDAVPILGKTESTRKRRMPEDLAARSRALLPSRTHATHAYQSRALFTAGVNHCRCLDKL